MATQYDLPWINPLGGFELYDKPQALQFINAGLEVGIARQEAVWCLHWGPPYEPSRQQRGRRQSDLRQKVEVFRQLYPEFIGVPARMVYGRHRDGAGYLRMAAREFDNRATDRRILPRDPNSEHPTHDRLGVIIVAFNGREVLLRALRALLPQCRALKDVESQVVVVDNGPTDGMVEVVHPEFPEVTVIANAFNGGPACGFNFGLRHVGLPSYVLVMHHDVELTAGSLARMVSYLREHPSIAGVIGSLINRDGTIQFQRMNIMELVSRRHRRPQPITLVRNTCALVRGEVFFDVGLYDERFHFWNEDFDWSLRAKRKGYRFTLLPEAKAIYHWDGESNRGRPAISTERFVANLWLVYKHGGGRWAAALYSAHQILERWLAFRWRNDSGALRQLDEAMARVEHFYRKWREGNRLPQLLQ
jgi:GT2 family glycosyltransferase